MPETKKGRPVAKNPRKDLGFGYAVTPRYFAKQALDACQKSVGKDVAPLNTTATGITHSGYDRDNGWRDILAERVARLMNTSNTGSVTRRIHQIQHGDSKISKADLVETMCVAAGLTVGNDVILPELPGCKALAREAAEVYVEEVDPSLDATKLGEELYAFSNACWQNWVDQETIPDDEVLKVNNLEFLKQIKDLVSWPTS